MKPKKKVHQMFNKTEGRIAAALVVPRGLSK